MPSELPWTAVPARPLVLVPVGSFEQHGPHLPMDTDSVVASAVAERVGRETDAFVGPVLAYGASGEHQGFPGTISLGTQALAQALVELVRSLSQWAGHALLVNGHGGNVEAIGGAVARLRREGRSVDWVACAAPGVDAHAGRAETSLMLHLAPSRVRLDAAVRGDCTPVAELMPVLRARGVRAVSPTGVLGDPAGASATEGAALLDVMVATVLDRLAVQT